MTVIVIATLILTVVIVVRFFLNLRQINYKLKDFVCPPQNFLFGHAQQFNSTSKILFGLQDIVRKHGKLLRINVGFCFPFLLVTDVQFLEFLLTSNKLIEKSADYRFFKRWLGEGLLTSSAKKWSQTRKIITPAFHFQILEQFIEVFNNASGILLNKLQTNAGKDMDIYPFLTALSFDVICDCAMDTSVDAQLNDQSDYQRSVRDLGRIFAQRGFEPIKQCDLFFFFSKDYWKERRAAKIINAHNRAVIEKRKLEKPLTLGEPTVDSFGRKRHLTFLDLLLHSQINGRPMNNEEIMDEVNTFMLAGHDTTSSGLSFILYCLSRNLDVQEKVTEELRNIYCDDKFRPVTYVDLQKMRYMDMVIKETFRVYPPVPLFARKIYEDEPYYGGILPGDTSITVFTFGLHHDPDIYPEPEKFDPERFTIDNQAKRHPFSYIPFSAGPRNCIGQRFAMFEMKTVLTHILRNFQVLPVLSHEVHLSFEVVLKSKNGFHMIFDKRDF